MKIDNQSYIVVVNNFKEGYDFYIVAVTSGNEANKKAALKYVNVGEKGSGELYVPEEKPNIEFDENAVSQLFTFLY